MTAELNQQRDIQYKEPAWDIENYTGNLYSLSFNGHGIDRIQNLFLSFIVDWQLTNAGEDPTQLKLFFPEHGF